MRGILEERQTRSYLAFILLLAAAMVAAACLLGWGQTDRMRTLYFQWEGRVSSGLLGEGVEPAVIARAFAGTEVTAEGERFLLQAGYTEETTPLWLLPDLYEAGMRQVGGVWYSMVIFMYGFLAVIALISMFNIINSIGMSVEARMKQYGAMRAIGMSSGQLIKMVAAEALTYVLSGMLLGCVVGLPLHRLLYQSMITSRWGDEWQIPGTALAVILAVMALSAVLAVWGPARRIRNMSVVDTISAL